MALLVATGTYTGNGATSGTRSITGIGFQPKVVFVWCANTGYAGPFYIQDNILTDTGENLGYLGENGWGGASTTEDRFGSIDSDGFTINNGSTYHYLNFNSETMYYLALGGDDIVTGKYTGNNTDNRSITGVGFQPIWVWVMGGNQHQEMKFDSSGASTDTCSYTWNAANISNGIQALETDGFQVGTFTGINSSSYTYYYFAVKAGPNVYQTEYTGNNTDNREITGSGFRPDWVFIKSEAARNFGMRSSDHVGDLSKYYRSTGFAANYIQELRCDGFQIGNAADINTSSDILGFIAFKRSDTTGIQFDATKYDQAYATSSITTSHTCTGTDRFLVVVTGGQNNAASSVTYNGVSMTQVDTSQNVTSRYVTTWYLKNPASGANNIVATYPSSSGWHYVEACSYTGVDQTSPIVDSGGGTATAATLTASMTTTAADQWGVIGMSYYTGSPTSSYRSFEAQDNTETAFYDSNRPLPSGSTDMQVAFGSSIAHAYNYLVFKPASGTVTVRNPLYAFGGV